MKMRNSSEIDYCGKFELRNKETMIKIHDIWQFLAITVRYELFLMCPELHIFMKK